MNKKLRDKQNYNSLDVFKRSKAVCCWQCIEFNKQSKKLDEISNYASNSSPFSIFYAYRFHKNFKFCVKLLDSLKHTLQLLKFVRSPQKL